MELALQCHGKMGSKGLISEKKNVAKSQHVFNPTCSCVKKLGSFRQRS